MPRIGAAFVRTDSPYDEYGHTGIVTSVKIVQNDDGSKVYQIGITDANRNWNGKWTKDAEGNDITTDGKIRDAIWEVPYPDGLTTMQFIHEKELDYQSKLKKTKDYLTTLYDKRLLAREKEDGTPIKLDEYISQDSLSKFLLFTDEQMSNFLDLVELYKTELGRAIRPNAWEGKIDELLLGKNKEYFLAELQKTNEWKTKHQGTTETPKNDNMELITFESTMPDIFEFVVLNDPELFYALSPNVETLNNNMANSLQSALSTKVVDNTQQLENQTLLPTSGNPFSVLSSTTSLSGLRYIDVKVADKTYILALDNINTSDYRIDPDGTKSYRSDVYVVKISGNQATKQLLGTYYIWPDSAHGSIDTSGNSVKVFFNQKPASGSYAMSGPLFTLNADTLNIESSTNLFTNANWGWFPIVMGDDVNHFSFAGYYRYINGSYQGYVSPDAMSNEQQAYQSFHSAAVEPNNDTIVESRLGGTSTTSVEGGYDYVSWGKWEDPMNVPKTLNNHWVGGPALVSYNDLPSSGTATYNGMVLGTGTTDNGVSTVALNGTSTVNVDFGSKAITGTLNIKNAANNATWANASINASMRNNQDIFTGSTSATGQTGGVAGAFYGTGAKEVAGSWTLSNGASTKAAGVFAGKTTPPAP